MKSLKTLRAQLGYNQVEMAQHLGIGRTRLAKVERNNAKLSVEVLLKVAALEIQLKQNCDQQKDEATYTNHLVSFCKERIIDNELAIHKLQKQLERMQRNYITIVALPEGLNSS